MFQMFLKYLDYPYRVLIFNVNFIEWEYLG
jgi:hypothetical protein